MKREENARLEAELLDYLYGCHEDPDAIERRIREEPAVAALLEEARAAKALLDDAAREETPAVEFAQPRAGGARGARGALHRGRFGRVRRLAAAALVLLVAAPWAWVASEQVDVADLEDDYLRMVVSGPGGVPDGAPTRVRVETWNLEGEPAAARVSWRARDADGAVLQEGEGRSDGALDIDLPANLAGVRALEVRSSSGDVARETTFELAPGREAPLLHLSSDRPAYRPGENVWWRATALDRLSLAPREGFLNARVVDPKGGLVQGFTAILDQGVAAMRWTVPDDAPGGEYGLEVRDSTDSFVVERLPLLVQRYEPPRLAKTVDLDRETYAPGEEGAAEVSVERVEGGVAAGALVDATLVVDGDVAWSESTELDPRGRAVFAFQVPFHVERGEARFVARVIDGGVVETAVEPFVVPTGAVTVDLYPEGGELVAGARARVYAEVFDALQRPTSARGTVVDSSGRQVTRFETTHQGRGRFELVPERGESYRIELEEPGAATIELPAVLDTGVGLRALADGFGPDQAVRVEVTTPDAGPWIAGVFCRGRLVAQDTFQGSGPRSLALALPESVAGVLRVTVFDGDLEPAAERLVHRATGRELRIELVPARDRLVPGEHQSVDVVTTDERGRPVAAVLGLAVSDRAVRDMVGEDRIGLADQTWLMADSSVEGGRELEDVGELLGEGPEVAERVDLLLGTRGWRRFAWLDSDALVAEHGEDGKRLMLLEGRSDRPQVRDLSGGLPAGLGTARSEVRDARRTAVLASLAALLAAALWGMLLLPRPAPRIAGVLAVGGVAAVALLLPRWMPASPDAEVGQFAALEAVQEGEELLLEDDGLELLMALGYNGGGGGGGPVRNAAEAPIALAAVGPEAAGRPDEGGALRALRGDVGAGEPPLAQALDFDDLGDGDALRELGYGNDEEAEEERARRPAGRLRRQPVRVYAHQRAPRPAKAPRVDFAETVYWNGLLATSADGRARIEFDTSDRVTTWEVVADAHGAGRVGQAAERFEAVTPFHMEAKLPVELSEGDRLLLPVALVAGDPSLRAAEVAATVAGPLRLEQAVDEEVPLEEGRGRVLLPIAVTGPGEGAALRFAGRAGGWTDRVGRELRVVPRGFPRRVSKGGRVVDATEVTLGMPGDYVPGSLSVTLKLFPSPLAGLLEGVEGLLQEPYGCFEQASSVNYPNVLARAYLDAAGIEAPAAVARARDLMDKGYAKLVGYECSQRGYEWFGGDPGHEALTAYGLLEFTDMARVYDVDDDMLERTREWLLGRRDGKGGYLRNERALDSYGRAPAPVTDAYCTYALVLAGEPAANIETELERLATRAVESEDAYEVALAAAALHAAGRTEVAETGRERLKEMQEENGRLVGSTKSITCSGGNDLAVETTSLAVLAWLADPDDEAAVRRGVEWLLEQRSGAGRFGATQATIQALRALTEYARVNRRVANAGELVVYVNDYEAARVAFEAGRREAIAVDGLVDVLQPGENRLRLELTGGNEFPWALDLAYFAEVPADDPDAAVTIETHLEQGLVDEGDTVPLVCRVANLSDEGQPMTLAIVGLPAGLDVPNEVLDDLKDAGRFDLWERRGREVVLYWRDLAPREEVELSLDCVATLPGSTTGPASRAYLYYTPGSVRWAEPLKVEVDPAR